MDKALPSGHGRARTGIGRTDERGWTSECGRTALCLRIVYPSLGTLDGRAAECNAAGNSTICGLLHDK
jgi:hypothetical protein